MTHTLIAGAGAVGGFLAWKLARAGWPITVLARGATADVIEREGLRVVSAGVEDVARLPVIRDLASPPDDGFDVALVTVKMPDLPGLAPALHGALGDDGLAVTVQNGLGAEELLAAELGAARVIGGVINILADRPAPGVVRHLAGGRLGLGALPGIDTADAARLSLHFEAAGVPCRVADDLRALRWGKLIWNVGFNPVTALARVTLGEAVDDPTLRARVRSAMEEAAAVARADGVELPGDVVERNLEVRPEYRGGLTSMLQDVLAGRPTEVEAIVGEVVRRGAALGVATPTLDELYSACASVGRP